jgi:signal transduction histidine kinase
MSDHLTNPEPRRVETTGPPIATFEEVDIRMELETRPRRVPDHEREDKAFSALAREMSENPQNMLQRMAEVALDLCGSDSAGVSVLEDDVFRWAAVAGVFAGARGGTMPRSASPCGVCIDRNATQLMHLADRCFPALMAEPRFVEALLIPFHHRGKAIGTVWIVSHSFEKRFDKEDERNVRVLAQLASAGWDLWQACEATAATSRRKDDFLAVLGHELRNPFAAITAAAEVLRQRVIGDAVATRAIDVISRQCQHTTRLAADLLDVARIGTGKLQLDRKRVDLRAIVADTIDTRRTQIERRRQQLTMALGAEPVWVEADPVRLAQVMSNLIDNAAKYTPESGQICVAITSEASEVRVEVHDNGIGLAPDQLTRIFEPFAQLRVLPDSSAGGLGLGLALVRSLTELHGGTCAVTSTGTGQGSCFTVRLPVAPQASAPN